MDPLSGVLWQLGDAAAPHSIMMAPVACPFANMTPIHWPFVTLTGLARLMVVAVLVESPVRVSESWTVLDCPACASGQFPPPEQALFDVEGVPVKVEMTTRLGTLDPVTRKTLVICPVKGALINCPKP